MERESQEHRSPDLPGARGVKSQQRQHDRGRRYKRRSRGGIGRRSVGDPADLHACPEVP